MADDTHSTSKRRGSPMPVKTCASAHERRDRLERTRRGGERVEVLHRRLDRPTFLVHGLKTDDLFRMRERRAQHHRVDHAEKSRVHAGAEREHEHGHRGKARCAPHHAKRVLHVVLQIRDEGRRVLAHDRARQARDLPPEQARLVARLTPLLEIGFDRRAEVGSELRRQQPDEPAKRTLGPGPARGRHDALLRSARVARAAVTMLSRREVSAARTFRPSGVSR